MIRALLLCAAALWASCAWAQPVSFAEGAASVHPPSDYTYALEDKGQTVVLRPPQRGLFELRLTYNAVPERKGHPLLAREFVIDVAKKKGKQPQRFKNGAIGFIERGPQTVNEEKQQFRNLQGLLAFAKGYVTLTLTVPEKEINRPEIKAFVNKGMQELVDSLQEHR